MSTVPVDWRGFGVHYWRIVAGVGHLCALSIGQAFVRSELFGICVSNQQRKKKYPTDNERQI